ncbi:MAG TPA: YeeE/YedE family protein, partial [Rhizobiales bacterium]|nr:YeeE/YedE family protein [Hyphomicrobiales bacterium]
MIGAPFSFYIALLGLLGGFAVGFVARRSNFCTLGAIEETYYGTERSRLRTWVLAVGVAILGTQALDFYGFINISDSFYLLPQLRLVGSILGGMLFGLGMALVGTCAFGMLLRAGGGDMRSLVSTLILGFVGYMTANGILAYISVFLVEAGNIAMVNSQTSSISELILGPSSRGQFAVALVLSLVAIGWALSSPRYLLNTWSVMTGVVFGMVIVYGWWVTGTAGQDGFEQVQFESYRFARPIGDTLVYAMTFSGASITFPIGGVIGVLLGAFTASLADGSFRFEAFDDPR